MKKFVNLPDNYKKFLFEIKNILNKSLIENLIYNKLSYDEINNLYNQINDIGEKYKCYDYDISKMINFYNKKNEIIEIIKKITSTRNKYIVYYASKTKFWKNNLNNLQDIYKNNYNKNIDINIIEREYINILLKYKYNWNGLWANIEMLDNGKIKDVTLFDIDDLNQLMENLNI